MPYSYQMDLYTLTPDFLIKYKIERYSSLIWTERYSSAGDFSLVVPPTPQVVSILHPGCYLALRGRREIMVVESQSFDSGLLTVSGYSLVKFLNQRLSWFKNPDYDHTDASSPLFADYATDDQTHGEFISDVVNKCVIDPPAFDSPYDDISLDWSHDKFAHLSLAHIDRVGYRGNLTFPNASQLYDGIEQLATEGHVGISLYLAQADFDTKDYVLRFSTYHGRDHTSDQELFPTIRFTPKTESMSNPKELRSNSEFKNVCYVSYKNKITVHYSKYVDSPPVDFSRRVIYVAAPDRKMPADKVPTFLKRVAAQAFRKHLHTHVIDGQVLGYLTEFKYPVDYYLGDIVEIEGQSGMIIKARISEYVRSQDQYGVKEYPTFEILAEDETNYASDPTFAPDVSDPQYPPGIPTSSLAPSPEAIDPIIPADDPLYPSTDPVFLGDDPNPDPLGPGDISDEGAPSDTSWPGGAPVISTQGLQPLTPWEVPAWDYSQSNVGFYVHSGNVYLLGSATADGVAFMGSDTLLVNIPPEFAPAAAATGRVLIDHANSTYEYAYDSGLKIGPWLSVTITPDGTMKLDDGNPLRPPGNPVDFTYLSLVFSDISWPISGAIYDAYGDTGPLDDYIASAAHIAAVYFDNTVPGDIWANIDGSYSAHDERLHFNGKVTVVGDYAGYPYDPVIGIDPKYQCRQSSEAAANGITLSEMVQKDGYRLHTYTPAGAGRRAVQISAGSQMPAAAGNNGCGFNARYFYERLSDGFLTRGENTALSFTPATPDAGVAYSGCKGSPVDDPGDGSSLPYSAVWRGNTYNVNIKFTIDDLLLLGSVAGPTTIPIDYTLIQGPNQHAFIFGMTPGLSTPKSYYKVVFTFDAILGQLWMHLILEQCGGSGRAVLTSRSYTPGVSHSTPIDMGLLLITSPEPSDVGFTGTPIAGWNYCSLTVPGGHFRGSDYSATPVGGGGVIPAGNPKGDMGFHFPSGSSAQMTLVDISGVGSFPPVVTGDVIDLTGCGWPIA
jgi:hypothetical protein